MNISEFASTRGIKTGTVSKYIREHQNEFDGHTYRDGKTVVLDDMAIAMLDAKYPQPVAIVHGIPTEEHYAIVQAKDREIHDLQQQIIRIQAENEKAQYRLGQLELLEDQAAKKEEELKKIQNQLQEKAQELMNANEEVERMRKRTLWQRIRNK